MELYAVLAPGLSSPFGVIHSAAGFSELVNYHHEIDQLYRIFIAIASLCVVLLEAQVQNKWCYNWVLVSLGSSTITYGTSFESPLMQQPGMVSLPPLCTIADHPFIPASASESYIFYELKVLKDLYSSFETIRYIFSTSPWGTSGFLCRYFETPLLVEGSFQLNYGVCFGATSRTKVQRPLPSMLGRV